MSKWENLETGNTFDSYEKACDDVYDNLSPSDVFDYIIETVDESDIIAALDGKKPDFYTNKFMELAEKQCDEYIVEILEDEEDEEEEEE